MAKRYFKAGSVASDVFRQFCEDWDLFFTIGTRPTAVLAYGVDQVLEWKQRRKFFDAKREQRRWAERKLVRIRKTAQGMSVCLTNRGFLEYARLCSLQSPFLPDGKSYLVVFDVPEITRSVRRELRGFLRASGFQQVQQSVWRTRRDVGGVLRVLKHRIPGYRWIRAYQALEV